MKVKKTILQMLVVLLCVFMVLPGLSAAENLDESEPDGSAKLVNVRDFGAIPTDGQDDVAGVVAAVYHAQSLGSGVTLVFPKGEYKFANIPSNKQIVSFTQMQDLVIDGQDSTFIVSGADTVPFSCLDCTGFTIKNVSIEWDKPYFSQGKVVGVSGTGFDVEFDPEYPITGNESIEGLMDYDPATRSPIANLDVFKSAIVQTQLIRPQVLRITIKTNWSDLPKKDYVAKVLANMKLGTLILTRHQIYGAYAIDVNRSSDIKMENINIYSIPGQAIHGSDNRNMAFKNIKIMPRPESGRLMSSTGDGVFLMFVTGTISLEDSTLEASGDDLFAVTAKYYEVATVIDATTIEAVVKVGWQGPQPKPGDKLELSQKTDLVKRAELTVKSSQWIAATKRYRIVFEEALPAGVTVDDVFFNTAYNPEVLVKNSKFANTRSRAIIMSARHAVIENNEVKNTGLAGIMLYADRLRSHHPAPTLQDVIIKNNKLEGCGGPCLFMYAGATTPGQANEDITIQNNTFRESVPLNQLRMKPFYPKTLFYASAVHVSSIKGLTMRGNSFDGYAIPAYIGNTSNALVENNQFTNPSTTLVFEKSSAVFNNNMNMIVDAQISNYDTRYVYYNDMR